MGASFHNSGTTSLGGPGKAQSLLSDTVDSLFQYLQRVSQGQTPGTGFAPLQNIVQGLELERWIEQGGMDESAFAQFLPKYLEHSVQVHHPHYMAHQVAAPDTPGMVAALVNAVLQNPMAIYEMGPAASAMEYAVIRWMCRKIGWTAPPFPYEPQANGDAPPAGGVLTHGGSLANLTALLAARSFIAPQSWKEGIPSDLAVMAPQSSHYSVARAASVLGIGAQRVYAIPTNAFGVMDPSQLASTYAKIQQNGQRCFAVVANACSTATGLHDPIQAAADFCEAQDLWLHVDACHGASALLSPSLAPSLAGIERAHSVVWDAHKMMQVPVLCAALLVRDRSLLAGIFDQDANYLSFNQDPERYSAMPFAIECTKSSMSLKVFLMLAMRGERAMGEFIEQRYAMTHRFYEVIQSRPGFSCPCPPQTNILCFRYGENDELQEKIRDTLLRQRRFHLSSATVNGQRHLRITVMNAQSNLDTLQKLLEAVESCAKELASP